MVAFDADVLRVDPGVIALGGADADAGPEAAAAAPAPGTPACQAALVEYRTAHQFRVLYAWVLFAFTILLALFAAYAVYQAVKHAVDTKAVIAIIGAVANGGAALFLTKRLTEAIGVAKDAIADVEKYCGTDLKKQLA
jgi:hypothetical protein